MFYLFNFYFQSRGYKIVVIQKLVPRKTWVKLGILTPLLCMQEGPNHHEQPSFMGSDSICFMIEGKVDMHMDIADGLCMDRNLRNSCLMYAYLSKIHLKCHNKYEDCLTLFLTPTLFDDCY